MNQKLRRMIKRTLILTMIALLVSSTAFAVEVRMIGDANVRTGPGLDYEVIDVSYAGETHEYWDDTEYDDRGVAWYNIIYGNRSAWVSSKYAVLEDGSTAASYDPGLPHTEVSGYYMEPLESAAAALGLDSYNDDVQSEAPCQYTDGALTIGGYGEAVFFELTGPGYTLFGAAVGMDKQTAKRAMKQAGLLNCDDSDSGQMTFEHPSSAKSQFDYEGTDGMIIVRLLDGIVTEITWSAYTG